MICPSQFDEYPLFKVTEHSFSGALAAQSTAKHSSMIIETGPHVCIEIGTRATLFLWSKWLVA